MLLLLPAVPQQQAVEWAASVHVPFLESLMQADPLLVCSFQPFPVCLSLLLLLLLPGVPRQQAVEWAA
jgi:hypothetical protein